MEKGAELRKSAGSARYAVVGAKPGPAPVRVAAKPQVKKPVVVNKAGKESSRT